MSAEIAQNRYKITINGTDYTKHIPMPVKWSSLLDERLDEGRLSMKNVSVKLFAPMSKVVISFPDAIDRTEELTFLVSSDEASEIPVGSGRYNHEISLIEETKKLEGIIIDGLTFTNRLARTYTEAASLITISYSQDGYGGLEPAQTAIDKIRNSRTPKKKGESFDFMSFMELFDGKNYTAKTQWGQAHFVLTYNRENLINELTGVDKDRYMNELPIKEYSIMLKTGIYQAAYSIKNTSGTTTTISYEFAAAEDYTALPKWTIASVIDRLLDLVEPHLKGEKPRYHLNAAQAEEFSKIEAPEFAFTNMTLREALDQIGGYIHGMARLRGNEIYFDMLGGTEQAVLADPKYPYIANKYTQNIENYATQLDANVDNLVNILDTEEGVITEPYAGGYKSVRSEEAYARITDGNMVIATSYPIYSISKLEVGYLPNGSEGADITDYVFEAAEYGTLSSFNGLYPNSKAYAIYYTQGQKNIKGLSFKSPNVIGGAGSKYSIANIIKEVTGYDITPDWWSTIVNSEEVAQNYPKLSFRITYTPIFSARVQEHKLYYKDMHPRTLAYNQGANLIESRSFGENMRGAIARMGNAENIKTYRLNNMSLIPKVGQMWGEDYFVSSVSAAMLPRFIDVTVGLSKDFNRLSQYIGINSSRRFYEVSEKQAYNRDIVYSDYIVIGDIENVGSGNRSCFGAAGTNQTGISAVRDTFYQNATYRDPHVSAASIFVKYSDGASKDFTLPVVSTAFGNTMVFSFSMEDNYSAGKKSMYGENGKVSGYWQTDISYCDYYGRFDTMEFEFKEEGKAPTSFDDDVSLLVPEVYTSTQPLMRSPSPLVVKKDNREIIKINYQVHYVTNRKEIIVGPALTHNCPLVRGIYEGHGAALYVLNEKIGKFASYIDLSNAELVHEFTFGDIRTEITDHMTFKAQESPISAVAWVIADKATGELLLGANTPMKAGENIPLPTFTFKHKIYD